MIILDSVQGSPQWLADRAGVITASMFSTAREKYVRGARQGDYTDPAKNYAFNLAVERRKGGTCQHEAFSNKYMKRGNELEPEARMLHEARIGTFIEQGGLILSDDRLFGYSADGFIGDDGLAEYKCYTDPAKVRLIMFENAVNNEMDQIQGGMWITGRAWCDFVLYYPDLECDRNTLKINRIYRDEEYITDLVNDLFAFNDFVDEYVDKLRVDARANNALWTKKESVEWVSDGVEVIPEELGEIW